MQNQDPKHGAGEDGVVGPPCTSGAPKPPLPTALVFGLVLWLSLVCGGLVLMGIMTLLGSFGALGIGESGASVVLRLVAGLLFLAFAAVAFAALLYVVAGRRIAAYSHPRLRSQLATLGLRLETGRLAALAGVHYVGSDPRGRRLDVYLRDIRRRQLGSRRLSFDGVRVEVFVETALGTRGVLARPVGVMASALARLNRRFGLQPVEGLTPGDDERKVWARDPVWMRRVASHPVVAGALEELIPRANEDNGELLESALHLQPLALYWTARVSSRESVVGWVQRSLELLSSVADVTEELPASTQPAATERAMERRSRTSRSSIALWTLGGCGVVFALLIAIPFAVLFVVALAARLG